MSDNYDFNGVNEFDKYKKILDENIKHSEWSKSIKQKYKTQTKIVLSDFIKFLKQKRLGVEIKRQRFNIILPLIILFVSILATVAPMGIAHSQMKDSLQSEIDEEQNRLSDEQYGNHIASPQLQNRLNNINFVWKNIVWSTSVLCIFIVALIWCSCRYVRDNKLKINFYNDYIEIINDLILEK